MNRSVISHLHLLVVCICLSGCPESVPGPVERESGVVAADTVDGFVVWVEAGVLAGSPAPEKAPGGVAAWLDGISEAGSGPLAILNLREYADPDFGDSVAATLQVPIADFKVPTIEQANAALEFISANRIAGRTVVVHCQGGCGRTGTILALYLRQVRGLDGAESIAELRALEPCFVETKEQQDFVRDFVFTPR